MWVVSSGSWFESQHSGGSGTLTAVRVWVRVGLNPLQRARGAGHAPSGPIVALSPFSGIGVDVCSLTILKLNR